MFMNQASSEMTKDTINGVTNPKGCNFVNGTEAARAMNPDSFPLVSPSANTSASPFFLKYRTHIVS